LIELQHSNLSTRARLPTAQQPLCQRSTADVKLSLDEWGAGAIVVTGRGFCNRPRRIDAP